MNEIQVSTVNDAKEFIKKEYCVGCGACGVHNENVSIIKNKIGLYSVNATPEELTKESAKCPFLSDKDEDVLSKKYYNKKENIQYERHIGFYTSLYGGHVSLDGIRERGSSGGMTSWVLRKLILSGEIDAVIHVGISSDDDSIFDYRISESIAEIDRCAKSRYYPVKIDTVVRQVLREDEKSYAFVGIPCQIKAMRLLCESDENLRKRIKYFVGIFCGHLKSASFSELLAWQQGIAPNDLSAIDFRVKNSKGRASNYSISVTNNNGDVKATPNSDLYGTDWGLGYFKPKACEWCDDVSGELADIVCGDAWLPDYVNDPQGANIVIVRSEKIQNIFEEGMALKEIDVDTLTPEKIIQSQAGNYRHRQEGLSVRISNAEKRGLWHPRKRIKAETFNVSSIRQRIYMHRMKMSEASHYAFLKAKSKNKLWVFFLYMLPYEVYYYYLNHGLGKAIAKTLLRYGRLMSHMWRVK